MLTRIEIDGFKSFLDFELDVPPFLALARPNSSGKLNATSKALRNHGFL